ncbi:aryl-sulfate sulfotransferase [Natronomonas sp. EA1]|uniref:aryl-sulfate sulfotransferase n=1 Tax=Natronomonas sp. EA1 TaxID=3421655 RepID=UPI003EBA1FB6
MDTTPRVRVLAAVVLLTSALLAGTALTHDPAPPTPENAAEAYPGHTLITLQAEGWFGNDNGYAAIVSPEGELVWKWGPADSRIFDAEYLENGNVLASVATVLPAAECPDEFDDEGECVHNRVVEVDYDTKEVVWEYDWYDVFPEYHEVHDADRLPNGETAIIDMGNNRAFTVNQEGEITWSWQAEEHIGEGTDWWNEHVSPSEAEEFRKQGPESDWTHMNDIDRLDSGHFTLSIRNFDVVLEVDPATNDIVATYGEPGKHAVMNEQHNPNYLDAHDTMLIADSENNRVVEIDARTEEIIWRYDGTGSGEQLQWPRDADRLPNGNTLITDSRNFRVVEVNANGSVVWSFDTQAEFGARGIVYEADRIHLTGEHLPEEPDDVPPGDDLDGRSSGSLREFAAVVESWLGFVLPPWVGLFELAVALVDVGALLALGRELTRS